MKQLQIGNVKTDNIYILGPMAGVSDLPFRLLCKEMGAGLVCMEMVSAKAIAYKNKKTFDLMQTLPQETPVSLQLFGSEPELMAEVAKTIEEEPFDILDINMGCPVPKVVNNGEGSALMKNPKLAAEIVRAISRAIEKPVTAKIRIGFDEAHLNAVEMAKYLEDAGAAAVAVHGRTREQYYSGRADWEMIARVKEAVGIPVIGNGDVTCPEDAERLQKETGCDGIMIARAAEGNPWIFRDMVEYEEKGSYQGRVSQQEIAGMILRHARLQIEYKGEKIAMREMRKHAGWYTAGCRNSSHFRGKLNQIEHYEQLKELILEWTGSKE
jgi:tRNA-dihydrouridine synthase B